MIRLSVFLTTLAFLGMSCGIKGKPLPPLEPAPLGNGQLQKAGKTKKP